MVEVRLPSGRVERCSKPGDCRRHDAHMAPDFRRAMATERMRARAIADGVSFPPIIRQPTPLNEPQGVLATTNGFDYRYTGIDQAAGYGRFQGLRLVRVTDLRTALAEMFGVGSADVPEDLLTVANDLGMNEPGAWDIYADRDYYDEYATLEAQPEKLTALREWYWDRPNAHDPHGILAYCRAKGLDTTGLNPLAAIKAQLAQENPGRTNPRIEQANTVSWQRLTKEQLHVPHTERILNVEARAAVIPAGVQDATHNFHGVVYHDNRDRYVLMDGYHRTKTLGPEELAAYIVLSNDYP